MGVLVKKFGKENLGKRALLSFDRLRRGFSGGAFVALRQAQGDKRLNHPPPSLKRQIPPSPFTKAKSPPALFSKRGLI